MADAEEALTLLLSIGNGPTAFTEDQLMKIVLVGMTTMGNIISNFADPTSTGSVAAGFTDTCTQIPSVAPTSAQYFGVAFNAVVMAMSHISWRSTVLPWAPRKFPEFVMPLPVFRTYGHWGR